MVLAAVAATILFVPAAVLSVVLVMVIPLLLLLRRCWNVCHVVMEDSVDATRSRAVDVVVIGGGFGGLTCCGRLLHHAETLKREVGVTLRLTLVEPRDYLEYTPGILRALVSEKHHNNILTSIASMPLSASSLFSHKRTVAAAIAVTAQRLLVGDDSEWIHYDFLVVATGSAYDHNIKPLDITSQQTVRELRLPTQDSSLNIRISGALPVDAAAVAAVASPSSSSPAPVDIHSLSHRLHLISELRTAVCNSGDILIVGAGLVGVVRLQ
jgi:NADPH-dependent 2,4-dienoyl-CoA reductase/sulfur reductase-like enzyme